MRGMESLRQPDGGGKYGTRHWMTSEQPSMLCSRRCTVPLVPARCGKGGVGFLRFVVPTRLLRGRKKKMVEHPMQGLEKNLVFSVYNYQLFFSPLNEMAAISLNVKRSVREMSSVYLLPRLVMVSTDTSLPRGGSPQERSYYCTPSARRTSLTILSQDKHV